MKKVAALYLVTFFWMGVIFYMSHQPPSMKVPLFPHQDKFMHFTAYFVLCLGYIGILKKHRVPIFWGVVFAAIYGISDEYHQSFIPGRDVSLLDWFADCSGAIAAYSVFPKRLLSYSVK